MNQTFFSSKSDCAFDKICRTPQKNLVFEIFGVLYLKIGQFRPCPRPVGQKVMKKWNKLKSHWLKFPSPGPTGWKSEKNWNPIELSAKKLLGGIFYSWYTFLKIFKNSAFLVKNCWKWLKFWEFSKSDFRFGFSTKKYLLGGLF